MKAQSRCDIAFRSILGKVTGGLRLLNFQCRRSHFQGHRRTEICENFTKIDISFEPLA